MGSVVWLAAWGCGGDKDNTDTDTDTQTEDCVEMNVSFTASEVAGAGQVGFSTDLTGTAHVEHRLEGNTDWISFGSADASAGTIGVGGLRVASTHDLRVVVGDTASCSVKVETDSPPTGTPPFTPNADTAASWVPDQQCMEGGYVVFSFLGQAKSGVGIIDRDGKYVWAALNESDKPWGGQGSTSQISRVRPARDGKSLLWTTADEKRVDDIGEIIRVSMDGSTVTRTRALNAHHDFLELPDGDLAWLGYDFRDVMVPELDDTDPSPVVTDVIYTGPEGATDTSQTVTVFNMFDDYPGGIYYSGEDMKCTGGFIPGYCEFSHANSLGYVESQDAFYANFRWLDAVTKVNRSTGLEWVLGGQESQFTITPASDAMLHGHFSDVWAGGILFMDNHDPDPPSKLKEFSIDESAMTYALEWNYDSDKFENLLGDVRRMPIDGCDNYLVVFSAQGRVLEMTPAGDIVWDYAYPLGNVLARATFLPTLDNFGEFAYWRTDRR